MDLNTQYISYISIYIMCFYDLIENLDFDI